MKLLLDIGNSRVKWAQLGETGLQPMRARSYEGGEFFEWCRENLASVPPPQSVRVANVAGTGVADALTQWCQTHWHLEPVFAQTEREAGGVRNAYDDVTEMGVDRWLAMVAARQMFVRPLFVVSCGTAYTLDAINAAGEHLGGLILPSPALMQQALNAATQGARTRGAPSLRLRPGRSTRDCVAAGVTYAAVGMIERAFEQLVHEQGSARDNWCCLITGGAAEGIMALCRLPLEPVPDLVLRGLAFYAEQSS